MLEKRFESKNEAEKEKGVPNLPEIIKENPDGTITVTVFGKGEKGGTIERSLTVDDDYIKNQKKGLLKTIKPLLEKELGGKLNKFIPNKRHRKALYAVLISLGLKHVESIEETAFYIKELHEDE